MKNPIWRIFKIFFNETITFFLFHHIVTSVREKLGRRESIMKNEQITITRKNESKTGDNGFKIIEVNITDPAENLFSVVTPIKKQ
ncbi:hypothetical protein [Neobacillus endophyticus]|uniref:hypothetical protein n=1 Tax=Neobacillus endophyticus TaxID=2738405 RepID=UPI001C2733F2|nr:hypothetical protein [Neobacillus endophyticus]